MYFNTYGIPLLESAESEAREIASQYINEFFPGLEMPDIKIVNRISAGWNGRCEYKAGIKDGIKSGMKRPEILIQKAITNDRSSFERIIAHELIHAYEYMTEPWYVRFFNSTPREQHQMVRFQPDGHGKFFQEYASKINAIKGKDFVTKVSDEAIKVENTKEFYVLIEKWPDGHLSISSFSKKTPDTKFELKRRFSDVTKMTKLFKTNDRDFLMPSSIGRYGKGRFNLKKSEESEKLQSLFNSGDGIDIMDFSEDHGKIGLPLNEKVENLNVEFHTVMVNITDEDAINKFKELQSKIDPKDYYSEHPYKPDNDNGREEDPHTTIFYGIKNSEDYYPILEKVKTLNPLKYQIGNVSAFRNDDKPYDVLKVEVKSKDMSDLHYWIRDNFENGATFPYNGHITLGYIRKGTCENLEGPIDWSGTEYSCSDLIFSDRDEGHKIMKTSEFVNEVNLKYSFKISTGIESEKKISMLDSNKKEIGHCLIGVIDEVKDYLSSFSYLDDDVEKFLKKQKVVLEIEHIEIKQKNQGKGFGKALLNEAIIELKKIGSDTAVVLNASPRNEDMNSDQLISFYKKVGFKNAQKAILEDSNLLYIERSSKLKSKRTLVNSTEILLNSDKYLMEEPTETIGWYIDEGSRGDYKDDGIFFEHDFEDIDDSKTPGPGIVVYAYKGKKAIASASFLFVDGKLGTNHVEVDRQYRRKGIASAMYQYAEKITGKKIFINDDQTSDGKSIWSQPHRPFGESLTVNNYGIPLVEDIQNLHSSFNKQSKHDKGNIWKTTKESSNILEKCRNQRRSTSTITESLSSILNSFAVANVLEMNQKIDQFFEKNPNKKTKDEFDKIDFRSIVYRTEDDSHIDLDLNMYAKKLGKQFRVLKLMAYYHKVDLDVDDLMDSVLNDIKDQVITKDPNGQIYKFIYVVRKSSVTEDSYESSFKRNFKQWCDGFIKIMAEIKCKFPWIDARSIARRVLEIKF